MEIYEADTIEKYNRYFGFETRHPLVGIVHFDDTVEQPTHCMRFLFAFHQKDHRVQDKLWKDIV